MATALPGKDRFRAALQEPRKRRAHACVYPIGLGVVEIKP